MSDVRSVLGKLETGLARLEERMALGEERLEAKIDRLAAILEATLPHLATKAEIAVLPMKTYLWGVVGVLVTAMIGAFGAGWLPSLSCTEPQ